MTLVAVGFLSLLSQIVLLRELNVAFYGVELVYLVALSAWLAGTAAGASFPARSDGPRYRRLSWLAGATAVALPADVALVRGSRLLLGGLPGGYLPLERQAIVLVAAVVPMAFLFGLAFRRAAASHVAAGGRLAVAYALECAGAAAGGLLVTLAFWGGLQTFAAAVATAGVGAASLASRAGRRRTTRTLVVALVLAAAGVALQLSGGVDQRMTRWTHPTLVTSLDTPYARVSISRTGSQVSVFENDVLAYESETADNEVLPHIAALQHPAPRRVLLLGGSVDRIDVILAQHAQRRVDRVEIDGAAVDAVERATRRNEPRETDERGVAIGLRVADPRAELRRQDRYDLIVVAMPEPVSGQTSRFYTREFFSECAGRLNPGGVVGIRLPVHEGYLAPAARVRAASVTQALAAAFRFVDILPASTAVAVASNVPLPDPEEVVRRMTVRHLQAKLVTPAYVRYLYASDRREALRTSLAEARVPINRDGHPVAYLHAAIGWLSRFVPALIGADAGVLARPRQWHPAWHWGLLVSFVALWLLARRHRTTRRAALVGAAGFSGMAIQTIVLLHYQSVSGALFEDLGLLVTAFMVGSALGAWALGRRASSPRRTTALLLAGLGGCAALAGAMVAGGMRSGLTATALLLVGVGAMVGALFAAVSRAAPDEASDAGALYASDVAGAWLAAVATSLVLVPIAGLDLAAGLTALFSLAALLLV